MMPDQKPACPKCHLADKSYKVSILYLQASARLNHRDFGPHHELDQLLADLYPPDAEQDSRRQWNQLVLKFSPPSGQKKIARSTHPDLMVIFFSLITAVLLYQIALNQPEVLTIAVVLFAASLLVYGLTRRKLVQRYENHQRRELEEKKRVETRIAAWMHLFYCSRDHGIFDSTQSQFIPIDEYQ